jgi:hypothetical protein
MTFFPGTSFPRDQNTHRQASRGELRGHGLGKYWVLNEHPQNSLHELKFTYFFTQPCLESAHWQLFWVFGAAHGLERFVLSDI